jgi:hypothetical protein
MAKLTRIGGSPILITKEITQVIEKPIHTVEKVIQSEPTPGEQGKDGSAPAHEVRNGEVRFQNPDGTWGEWIQAQQAVSVGGKQIGQYIPVREASIHIGAKSLLEGHNIIGVNYAGDVTIILPRAIDKNVLITVKDESNNADLYNITIESEI